MDNNKICNDILIEDESVEQITEETQAVVVVNPYNYNNQFITEREISILFKRFDIHFEPMNIKLYHQAFTHKSYTKKKLEEVEDGTIIQERPEGAMPLQDGDNERLEFLGDSVLSPVVAKYLYERFPDEDEGFMTRIRSKLVCGEMLGKFGKELQFGKWMIVSRHIEDVCLGRQSEKLLEDCFEAFMGAMYLDFNEPTGANKNQLKKFQHLERDYYSGIGFHICEKFFINLIEEQIDFVELINTNTNYKDQLTRLFQKKWSEYPIYDMISMEELPSGKLFTMGVYDPEGNLMASSIHNIKKKAEQMAAKEIIDNWKE